MPDKKVILTDDNHKQAKIAAATQGTTITDLVNRWVAAGLKGLKK